MPQIDLPAPSAALTSDPWFRRHYLAEDGDSFHTAHHTSMAVEAHSGGHAHGGPSGSVTWTTSTIGNVPTATMIVPQYVGWYVHLVRGGGALPPQKRSWRVNVVVQPLGWLGKYRRSRYTGMWFTGQHRWHLLGYPDSELDLGTTNFHA